MKKTILLCLLLQVLFLQAQNYQPDWASLDSRPVPQWFTDAKFGIFIHWGVYSVPAFTSKGNYAEWYQNALNRGDSATVAYHKAKFGNLSYYQLADQFKAELFQPDEWARIFEQSGAKYIVLTSKHHDGFTLWPSKDASRTWGFPWNAGDTGPKRDLLGDLFKAVRKTSVHAGMYYSLYEWFNPLWKSDPAKYAIEHMWPQMKELINTYQPDVFWTDGDWDASDNVWKSKEFLAWLYNSSPVKDKVVTYDRWGKGLRFKHGGVFTPEYQPNLDFENHPWEESRGMGYSYGYNREEDAWDYNSTQSLVYHLLDKVSRGGNFLLDIGPDEHGKIPPIMQERLLQIGDWLKINGNAIYGTERWKNVCQWSEGKRDYQTKKGEDIMMKLTVDPDPGYAVKEVFYTYHAKTNSLFAVFPKYPSNKKLVLKNMPAGTMGEIRFLSTNEKLNSHREGMNLVIDLPEYDPNQIKAPYAYAVEIKNYGAYLAKPVISLDYADDLSVVHVSLSSRNPAAKIKYLLDDGRTDLPVTYTGPFDIKQNTVVKAFATGDGNLITSDTTETDVKELNLYLANTVKNPLKGISYQYYESDKMNMAALKKLPVVKQGIANEISTAVKQRTDKYGLVFDGYIKIEKLGAYVFSLTSDDGSILYIDDKEMVNNDGDHGDVEKEGRMLLENGYHKIRIQYYDAGGGNSLLLRYGLISKELQPVPASVLFH